MDKTQTKKKKSTWMKVGSIILDILVIPIIILAFVCTILTFSAKANNKVPQIFGKSIVTVLSDSMEPEYMVGDVLIISKTDVNTLKIGDNIAFYAPIWLEFPFTATVNGKKVSNIIYHQIVDIIYPKNEQGEPVRHFVCRGINVHAPSYVYVGPNSDRGNYKKTEDGEYVMSPGTGDYAIVLEDLIAKDADDLTTGDVSNSNMRTMQYITDEYVVGIYDSSLSPAIGGFIKFASSSMGLAVMVIIPAALMIVYVVISMLKDIKASKEEDRNEELVLESNVSRLKETSAAAKVEAEKSAAAQQQAVVEEKKVEELDLASVISGAVASRTVEKKGPSKSEETKAAITKQQAAVKETEGKTSVGKQFAEPKSTTIVDVKGSTKPSSSASKTAPKATATAVKTASNEAPKTAKVKEPQKASTEPKTLPKTSATVKTAPIKAAAKPTSSSKATSAARKTPTQPSQAKPTTVKKTPPKKDE